MGGHLKQVGARASLSILLVLLILGQGVSRAGAVCGDATWMARTVPSPCREALGPWFSSGNLAVSLGYRYSPASNTCFQNTTVGQPSTRAVSYTHLTLPTS